MDNADRNSAIEKINSDDTDQKIDGIKDLSIYGIESDIPLLENLKSDNNFVIQVEAEKGLKKLQALVSEKKMQLAAERKKQEIELERKTIIEKLLSSDDREKIRLEEVRKLEEIKRRKEAEKLKAQEYKKSVAKRKSESEKKKLEEKKQNAADEFRDNIRKVEMEKLGLVKHKEEYITKMEFDKIRASELEKNRKRSEAVYRKLSRIHDENNAKMRTSIETIKILMKLIYIAVPVLFVCPVIILSLVDSSGASNSLIPLMVIISTISFVVLLGAVFSFYNQMHQICLNRIIRVNNEEKVIDSIIQDQWLFTFFENMVFRYNPDIMKRLKDGEKFKS
ncbi:hypothetical protein KAJ27_06295 [bacterium]|nr:hypothetical protein [bacterium]